MFNFLIEGDVLSFALESISSSINSHKLVKTKSILRIYYYRKLFLPLVVYLTNVFPSGYKGTFD